MHLLLPFLLLLLVPCCLCGIDIGDAAGAVKDVAFNYAVGRYEEITDGAKGLGLIPKGDHNLWTYVANAYTEPIFVFIEGDKEFTSEFELDVPITAKKKQETYYHAQTRGFTAIKPGDDIYFEPEHTGKVYITIETRGENGTTTEIAGAYVLNAGRNVIVDKDGYLTPAARGEIWIDEDHVNHRLGLRPDENPYLRSHIASAFGDPVYVLVEENRAFSTGLTLNIVQHFGTKQQVNNTDYVAIYPGDELYFEPDHQEKVFIKMETRDPDATKNITELLVLNAGESLIVGKDGEIELAARGKVWVDQNHFDHTLSETGETLVARGLLGGDHKLRAHIRNAYGSTVYVRIDEENEFPTGLNLFLEQDNGEILKNNHTGFTDIQSGALLSFETTPLKMVHITVEARDNGVTSTIVKSEAMKAGDSMLVRKDESVKIEALPPKPSPPRA